jgi:hypothetical protein
MSWSRVPADMIQVKSDKNEDCFDGICRMYDSKESLLKEFDNAPRKE